METYTKPTVASAIVVREIWPLAALSAAEAATAAAAVAGFLYGMSKSDARPTALPSKISVLQETQTFSFLSVT